MDDCIFCKLVKGDIPSHTVYDDETTCAFLDIFPATDGHVVVIHKKHGDTILDYTEHELMELFSSVKKIVKAIETTYNTKILSIGINHGEPAGVHHLHVHIMPRFENDGGGIMQSLPGKKPTSKDFAATAKKLKIVLNEKYA
ncbi:HIT family protein [Candidatus Woesebacteria bacterium]|nr:HIT family protein [Candidatus Woesebacteria bacterium]